MAHHDILSPLPGTFYRKPSPDAAFYKNEGDSVKKGDVIGLIEVMKSFHEVHADADGNYEFNTLGDATYRIFVDSASFGMNYDNQFRAGVVTNLTLTVKPWSATN